MAYSEKYYKEITRKGRTYRLSIQQRDYTGTALEIGDLTALDIEVQAGTDDIIAPIVKSYCHFGVVDAWDINKPGQKWGRWEEFYTNDSTLYRVQVFTDDDIRWSGYITPDSWEEELCYRGSVTVTARDNVGHLADFDFEDHWSEAYINVVQIVEKCGELIGQDIQIEEAVGLYYNGWSGDYRFGMLSSTFISEAFKGMSWYKVLEDVLGSLGLALRYIDDATLIVTSLDRLDSVQGDYTRRDNKQAVFIDRSGHRTLVAPYKEIVDTIDYTYLGTEYDADLLNHGLLTPPASAKYTGQAYNLTVDSSMLPAAASVDYSKYAYISAQVPQKTRIGIDFVCAGSAFIYHPNRLYPKVETRAYAMKYRVGFVWVTETDTKYYHGTNGSTGAHIWNTTQYFIPAIATASPDNDTVNYTDFHFSIETPEENGYLEVRFYAVEGPGKGLLKEISYNITSSSQYKSHTQRTKYDANANVVEERESRFGQFMGDRYEAVVVKNAILSDNADAFYPGVTGWGKESDEVPRYNTLWEMIHKWILCYYSKPNNVLTGDFIDYTADYPRFSDIWVYDGKKHILLSGRLNILKGIMEAATLREYVRYKDLWDDLPVDAIRIEASTDETENYREGGRLIIPMRMGETDYLHLKIRTATGWTQPRVDVKVKDCYGEETTYTFQHTTDKADGKVLDLDLEADSLIATDKPDAEITITAALRGYDDAGGGWSEISVTGDNKIYVRWSED